MKNLNEVKALIAAAQRTSKKNNGQRQNLDFAEVMKGCPLKMKIRYQGSEKKRTAFALFVDKEGTTLEVFCSKDAAEEFEARNFNSLQFVCSCRRKITYDEVGDPYTVYEEFAALEVKDLIDGDFVVFGGDDNAAEPAAETAADNADEETEIL